MTPASVWYLPEGGWAGLEEWITVFNPDSGSVNVTFDFFCSDGTVAQRTAAIPQGPGRVKVRVTDWLPCTAHGTRVTAVTGTGAAGNVVVERTVTWNAGDPEGHSSPGTPERSPTWYFAEGHNGFLDTHFQLLNPDPSPASVRLEYFHQNGQVYQHDVTVLATSMKAVSVADFSAMPNGSFGTRVTVLSGPPFRSSARATGASSGRSATRGAAVPCSPPTGTSPRG